MCYPAQQPVLVPSLWAGIQPSPTNEQECSLTYTPKKNWRLRPSARLDYQKISSLPSARSSIIITFGPVQLSNFQLEWYYICCHCVLLFNAFTVAKLLALEIVRGSLAAERCSWLVPLRTAAVAHRFVAANLIPSQTKHAAELCALLVNDLFGELPSVSFYSLRSLQSGRLDVLA